MVKRIAHEGMKAVLRTAPIVKRGSSAIPSSVREINRAIVLNLVRIHQPISRVELSARTGIFRSSVSAIVDELASEGLLIEEQSKPKGRGRVPVNLYLNSAGYRVLGISIRPFETLMAVSGLNGEIESKTSFRTPAEPKTLLKELVKSLPAKPTNGFREVGISIPGMVNAATGQILTIPSLPRYADFPIASELAALLGVPASAENDCNLAALAEMWLNEAEVAGVDDFAYVQIGDVGVGAGLIIHKELYGGHDGTWVGEFGHMIVETNGTTCSCGRRGCWEQYVTDSATWSRYNPDAPYTRQRFQELITAARNGNAKAVQAFRTTAEWLSLGLSNIQMSLNPQRIVLAGEITQVWGLIEQTVESAHTTGRIRLHIYPARFAPEVLALHGSVILALRGVFAGPKLGRDASFRGAPALKPKQKSGKDR
jgi:predicted NBD/HSP70 family sugar kinase